VRDLVPENGRIAVHEVGDVLGNFIWFSSQQLEKWAEYV